MIPKRRCSLNSHLWTSNDHCDTCGIDKDEANGSVADLGVSQKKVIKVIKIGKKKKKKKLVYEVLDMFTEDLKGLVEEFNNLIEGSIDKVFKDLSKLKKEYAIVGGSAVKVYYKKGRDLTPDLDILISPKVLDDFKDVLSSSDLNIKSKGLWISTADSKGLELDYKIASKEFEKEVIKNAVTKNFKGKKLYFISLEYLIVMKLQLLRDKDEDDILGLLQNKDLNQKLLSNLVQKYAKDKMDDLEQLVMMSTLVKA